MQVQLWLPLPAALAVTHDRGVDWWRATAAGICCQHFPPFDWLMFQAACSVCPAQCSQQQTAPRMGGCLSRSAQLFLQPQLIQILGIQKGCVQLLH